MATATYDPNDLIAGDSPALVQRRITLAEGENLTRGTLLGRSNVDTTAGSATVAAKAGGNTGVGALTMDETAPVKVGAKSGVYTARCILAPGSNGGTFAVEDPDGNDIGQVLVGATFDDDIKFVITDTGTDYALGDGYDITVVAVDVYKKALSAATDGSQNPVAVLALDCNATDDPVETTAWFAGEFNGAKMTFGTGWSASATEAYCRKNNVPIGIRTLPVA
jgi:hypothetical protein